MFIIGHQKIRERLKKLVAENKVSQGYLFFGPESVGKSLCAKDFAYQLVSQPNFQSSDDQPHPLDVQIVRPETETKRGVTKQKSISAEEMRDALIFLSRFPTSGKFRVVIVEDAHKLSQTAQNVLLKTLEEPNTTSVIILVTHEIGAILPTILSRVEKVKFDYVSVEEMEGARDVLSEGKSDIAPFFFSLGRPGMVLRAAKNQENFLEERKKLEKLFKLSSLNLSDRMKLAEELSKNVPEGIKLLEWWLPGLHNQAVKNADVRHTARWFNLLENVMETLTLLKTTQGNARLLFEKLFFFI
jgi:DNA polymerase III subunit delta'